MILYRTGRLEYFSFLFKSGWHIHFSWIFAYNSCMIRRKGKASQARGRLTVRSSSVLPVKAKKRSTLKKEASTSECSCFEKGKAREAVKEVFVQEPRSRVIGTPMHPLMRTMFLSLAAGTMLLCSSMLYYIKVARATDQLLYRNEGSRITAETALSSFGGSFNGLIEDLEDQRRDAGGALPMPPREYLRLRAEQAGVSYALLNRIAYCESKWRMTQNEASTAYGYFQILDGTERLTPQYRTGLRKTDAYVNIDMAISLYQKYGTIPWTESESCWSND